MGNNPAVGVKLRIKNKGGKILLPGTGWRDAPANGSQQFGNARPGLGRDLQNIGPLAMARLGKFGRRFLYPGAGKVYLIQHRNDGQTLLTREVEMGERLGLHALGGIHQENGALYRGEGPRNLVAEIGVPRRIDQVEDIILNLR